MSNVNHAATVISFSFEIKTHYLCDAYSSFIHLFIHLFTLNKIELLLQANIFASICFPQQKKSPYNRFLKSDAVTQLQMNRIVYLVIYIIDAILG